MSIGSRKKKSPKFRGKINPTTGRRSKFEESFEKDLKRIKVPYDYEQIELPYTINYTYKPDWRIKLRSGSFLVETKGVLDQQTRRKMLAVKEQYPDLDLRIVFQNASNKIRRGSKTTYGEWADKNGFPWSEGIMPPEWLSL